MVYVKYYVLVKLCWYLFIWKVKKKKIYGLYYIFCFYVVKNWYMNFWNVKNDIIFLIFISKLKKNIYVVLYVFGKKKFSLIILFVNEMFIICWLFSCV